VGIIGMLMAIPEGLTDISADVAAAKQPIVALCRQVIAVVDATKWNRVGLASFAQINDIDIVITDRHAPPDLVEQVRALGVEVFLVTNN
jgi:DeoR/GlpR family transcriptional regulator of sugar metabolism